MLKDISTIYIITISSMIVIIISGIYFAAKTKDKRVRVWKVILHFIIWGGWIAAIIYIKKCGNNIKKESLIFENQNNVEEPSDDDINQE